MTTRRTTNRLTSITSKDGPSTLQSKGKSKEQPPHQATEPTVSEEVPETQFSDAPRPTTEFERQATSPLRDMLGTAMMMSDIEPSAKPEGAPPPPFPSPFPNPSMSPAEPQALSARYSTVLPESVLFQSQTAIPLQPTPYISPIGLPPGQPSSHGSRRPLPIPPALPQQPPFPRPPFGSPGPPGPPGTPGPFAMPAPSGQPPSIVYLPLQQSEGPKLKEPDIFTGRDPTKLSPFIAQCVHWFIAKPRAYSADRERVLFTASYLRDLASVWWMPILVQQPPSMLLDSWDAFTAELFTMFGNKHLQSTAQNALLNIKMKDNSRVSEYLVAFNSHATYTGWNDVALAGHFYRGLPDRIKDMMQYIQRPQTFAGMRQSALDFDQRYWERQEEIGRRPEPLRRQFDREKRKPDSRPTSESFTHRLRPQPAERPASTAPTSAPTPNVKKQTKSDASTPSQSTPRGPLPQEEKDRRRAEGLCLYCADKGHTSANCPKIPTHRRNQTGRAVFTFTTKENASEDATPKSENDLPAQDLAEDL